MSILQPTSTVPKDSKGYRWPYDSLVNPDTHFEKMASLRLRYQSWVPSTGRGEGYDRVNHRISIAFAAMENKSGGAANVGFGIEFVDDPSVWKAGQYKHGTTTYTDDTTDAQDAGAGDFSLPGGNTYGISAGCVEPFSLMELDISTTLGAGGVTVNEYYDGSTWRTISAEDSFAFNAVAKTYLVFLPPLDWAKGSDVTGHDTDKYWIRTRHTTGYAVANGAITRIKLASLRTYESAVANDDVVTVRTPMDPSPQADGRFLNVAALAAYFGTANARNRIDIKGEILARR